MAQRKNIMNLSCFSPLQLFLLLIFLVSIGCKKVTSTSASPADASIHAESFSNDKDSKMSAEDQMTEEFMMLVNNHRISLGKQSLEHSDGLARISLTHSEQMANKTVAFGHTGFSQRCHDARVILGGGDMCAENVAMGQKTAAAVFNSWMNSTGHRANLEQSRFTHTGFGLKLSSSGVYYWTLILIGLD
jgi:uncharacterized protein YkwD